MEKRKTMCYGMSTEELNILFWAGCTFRPVYNKGSKCEGTRKCLFMWIDYPEGTIIEPERDFEMIEGLHTKLPDLITLPGDFPRLLILWGSIPEEGIAFYPLYEVDRKRSSRESLDWYYHSQRFEYEFPEMGHPEKPDRYYECTCCHVRTPFGRGWDYRKHDHHPNCIHLKKKLR